MEPPLPKPFERLPSPQWRADKRGARPKNLSPAMVAIPDPWRTLRRRFRWMLGLWLGWPPFGVLVMSLQDSVLPPPWSVGLALAYLGAFMVAGLRYSLSRCPRCGRAFALEFRFRWALPWAPRCLHCGIRLGAPLEGAGPAS